MLDELIWSVHLDADHVGRTSFGLEDSRLERSDVQHGVVAGRVVYERDIDARWQVPVQLDQVFDQSLAFLFCRAFHLR